MQTYKNNCKYQHRHHTIIHNAACGTSVHILNRLNLYYLVFNKIIIKNIINNTIITNNFTCLQKVTYCILKGKLLKAEKPCFTMQYAAFQETG